MNDLNYMVFSARISVVYLTEMLVCECNYNVLCNLWSSVSLLFSLSLLMIEYYCNEVIQ